MFLKTERQEKDKNDLSGKCKWFHECEMGLEIKINLKKY
jgi:hypothetical protein